MNVFIGADHRGFRLKEHLKEVLKTDGYTVTDVGAFEYNGDDDYPDFAKAVAEQVAKAPEDTRGIVICGSGTGVDIVANKFRGVRSVLAMSPDHVHMSRRDDNVNVLAIAADFIDEAAAMSMMKIFFTAPFDKLEERYARRLRKVEEIETSN
jgi:ribose 5-phosphate isomerase B